MWRGAVLVEMTSTGLNTLVYGRLTRDVADQLDTHFGERVFSTIVPRNIRLAEAPSFGVPALLYDKQSTGALAYMKLARELDSKHRNQNRGESHVH